MLERCATKMFKKAQNCSKKIHSSIVENELIDEFNGLLSSKYSDHASSKFVIIRLNELIRNVPRVNNSVAHYNQIYHDSVQLNYRKDIPYLKNILLQQLLKTSNGAVNTKSSNCDSLSYKMHVRNNSPYSTNLYGGF